mgnify:CR=1 FL=1
MPVQRRGVDREEIARAVLAALLLVTIAVGALLWPSLTPEGSTKAVALLIRSPLTMVTGTLQDILVEAINGSGGVDRTRNDTIKISLDCEAARIRCKSGPDRIWSREVTANLNEGITTIEFYAPQTERIVINATWLKGESPLHSHSITTLLLKFRSEKTEFPP